MTLHHHISQLQTRDDIYFVRENLQLFSQDLNKHLKLVDTIHGAGSDVKEAGSKLGEAATQLTKVVEKVYEKVDSLETQLTETSKKIEKAAGALIDTTELLKRTLDKNTTRNYFSIKYI